MVTGVYKGNSNRSGLGIYINGALDDFGGTSAIAGAMVNNENVAIGAETDGGEPFTGRMQHVAIWNRVLTDAEIVFLFNGGKPKNF